MEQRKRVRGTYPAPRQKKKLMEFLSKHPELLACKVTQDFNYKDSQRLWQEISRECNSIPGARKTWRQWRKMWQDMRSKMKKKQTEHSGDLSSTIVKLRLEEMDALGYNSSYQETTEFVPLADDTQDHLNDEIDTNISISEPESPPETKVFTRVESKKMKSDSTNNHSNTCFFNCDMLAVHEQRKVELKEDYINFRKDYLTQKLQIMKEQTEALKAIAKGLSENKRD